MIDEIAAGAILGRLCGLRGFPREKLAQRELRSALQTASSEQIAEAVVTDWLAESNDAPRPAELRRLISDRSMTRKQRCGACGGSGWMSAFRLVTYWNQTYKVKRSERLDHLIQEEVLDLRDKLNTPGMERQAILSCALPCVCLPAHHKAYTEG